MYEQSQGLHITLAFMALAYPFFPYFSALMTTSTQPKTLTGK